MNKKVVILGVLTVLLSITIAVGFSYAVWTQTKEQDVANTFSVGCFDIQISNEENTINLDNDYPITDETGKTRVPFTFTVTNTCDYYGNYAVNLEKLTGSDLGNQYIKVMLNNKRPQLYDYYNIASKEDINSVDSRTLTTDGLNAGESKEYSLRIWLDESGTNETVGGKTFNSKIVIRAVATYQSGAEYIASLLTSNPETMKNDDPDENVRYIGASPNNYVTFNDEQWRIIGVFDMFECTDDATVENYTSKCSTKKLLKIIREDFFSLPWNSSSTNDWNDASLQKLLNSGEYWHKSGNYLETGLTEDTQKMIALTVWNLGGLPLSGGVLTKNWYIAERSSTVYPENLDKWIGKVGLMYPSDYGFATGGGTAKNREYCLAKALGYWNEADNSDCKINDWLYVVGYVQWTLFHDSDDINIAYIVDGAAYGGQLVNTKTHSVRPVVYLKADVKILDDGMDGSSSKPYNLSL